MGVVILSIVLVKLISTHSFSDDIALKGIVAWAISTLFILIFLMEMVIFEVMSPFFDNFNANSLIKKMLLEC